MMLVPRRKDFNLFEDFFDDPFFGNFHENKVMKTDIKEHKDNFELLVDLPGYEKENVKMSISDGYLTITAKKHDNFDEQDKNGHFLRRERYSGECTRSFYVGDDINEDDIKACYKNGTLKVEIPKKEEAKKVDNKKYIEIE